MFFDDVKTLYDLDAPESGRVRMEQIYSDYRKGSTAKLDALAYMPLRDVKVIDLDTGRAVPVSKEGNAAVAKLDVPIVDKKQSAHLKITGTLADGSYSAPNGELVFERTVRGLRNTVLLPAGWDVSAVSQSATIGTYGGATAKLIAGRAEARRYERPASSFACGSFDCRERSSGRAEPSEATRPAAVSSVIVTGRFGRWSTCSWKISGRA